MDGTVKIWRQNRLCLSAVWMKQFGRRYAGVWVTIIGMSARKLSVAKLFDCDVVSSGKEVSPYLILDTFIPVEAASKGLFDLPEMVMGSNPVDGKKLSVSEIEREEMITNDPQAGNFIKPYLGGDELLEGNKRYCIWVNDKELNAALPDTVRQT